nr:hypothetical protein [Tanacetum cinerariifolium]
MVHGFPFEKEAAEAIHVRAQASDFEAVEKSIRDETDALKERNAILEKEQNALDVKVTLEASAVSKEHELIDLDALVTSVKSQNDILVDRFVKLYIDFVEMALHLEEKFYPHLLTTVSGRRWLLTYGMELAIVKCLNSPEYLFALGAAIGKAIEKGMQDELSAGIVHGKEGQQPRNVNFSLLAELKSNKDASVEVVMNIRRLEGPLAQNLGLHELQPNVDQLMVPIHRSPNKVVIGATALSLALDVSSFWVRRIKENIANQKSAFRDVFVPLAEPFFIVALTALKAEMANINKNLMKVLQINQHVKAIAHNYETYGGPHSYNDCAATVGQTQNIYVASAYNQGGNSYQPQGLSQGTTILNHQGKEVQKEERCSNDWRKVCSTCLETKGRIRPRTRTTQSVDHSTVVAETLKATTRVLAQKKRSLIPKNIITKEHPHEGRKCCRKAKVAQEDIRSQSQRGKSRVLRMTYPNHGGTFMKRRPEECYDLIENMTAHHNDWDTSVQWSESSSSITSSFDPEIVALKAEMANINKNLMRVLQINQQVKAIAHNYKTYGGPHSYNDCPATVGQTQNIYVASAYNQGGNSYQPQGHTTDECMHLKRQIKEMLKAGKLSCLIKELKQSIEKGQAKAAKREEDGTEGLMIIKTKIGGHCMHRIYVDGSSSSKILYEHCNRFRPEVKNQMIPATTPLVRSELASLFRMTCFVAPVDEVSWLETYVANPGIILFLKVGMPISTGITTFVPYASENGVSLLLYLIIVRGPTHRNYGLRKDLLYSVTFITAYRHALRCMAFAFLFSSGRISSVSTCLLMWAKLVDAILLSASAFLFSPLGICLMENSLKMLVKALNFSKYLIMIGSFAMPAIKASYYASLLVAPNLNLRPYVNSTSSGFVIIRPALKLSMHDDLSVNSIHGSRSAFSSSMGVS